MHRIVRCLLCYTALNQLGHWEFYGDYRALNHAPFRDRYSIPLIQVITVKIKNSWIFSKIVLVRVHHRTPYSVGRYI